MIFNTSDNGFLFTSNFLVQCIDGFMTKKNVAIFFLVFCKTKNQLGILHILLEMYTSVETIFFEYHNFFHALFYVIKLNCTEYF